MDLGLPENKALLAHLSRGRAGSPFRAKIPGDGEL
ncbi:hypothetical protein MDA_GLEAN10013099 [Myotis davidii]|uniref:Uncharacterized protein n=1 Tax=Myotis davidii TaxID=225400 RepID=L5LFS8_MYODS|nr:hypothetical protein MDA_GLEAN10013099 [Myotis davidii]